MKETATFIIAIIGCVSGIVGLSIDLLSYLDKKKKVSVYIFQLIQFCNNDFEHSGKCWLFLNISNLSNETLQISDITLSPKLKPKTSIKLLDRINDNPLIKVNKQSLRNFTYSCIATLSTSEQTHLFTNKHFGGKYDYLINWDEAPISFPYALQAKTSLNLGLVFSDSHYFINMGPLMEVCLSVEEYAGIEMDFVVTGPEFNIKKRIKKDIIYSSPYDKNRTDHSLAHYVKNMSGE